tara:strand:- start:314 stop:601 length:288 start_codon:yes stop_codon:yes gene_type:complete
MNSILDLEGLEIYWAITGILFLILIIINIKTRNFKKIILITLLTVFLLIPYAYILEFLVCKVKPYGCGVKAAVIFAYSAPLILLIQQLIFWKKKY